MNSDAFVLAYLECALWSSTDNAREDGGDPLDDKYSVADFDADSIERARRDCKRFRKIVAERLPAIDVDTERGGADFWLTRNGHGAGFWDGDWDGPEGIEGDALTDIAQEFRGCDAVVSDGVVYLEGGAS